MTTIETNNAPQELQSFWRRLRHTPVRDLLWRWRITGRMDVEAILTSYALPASCAEVVRRVVKKSGLWRLENAELTSELAAHFRDGLQEGLSETDLIRDFGDPAKAAKLIRRAKVRCRPMLWHIARGVVRAVAVFVLLYFVLVGYYALGKPEIKVNYLKQLNAAAEKVAPEDRAWPLYREAAIELGLVDTRADSESLPKQIIEAYDQNKPITPAMRDWLRVNEELLQRVRHAAAKPGLGYVHRFGSGPEDFPSPAGSGEYAQAPVVTDPYATNEPLMGLPLHYLGLMRSMAKLLEADAAFAADENDIARMYADLMAMDGIARHLYESPVIMNVLVGHCIRYWELKRFAQPLAQHPERFGEASLRETAHRLSGWDFRGPMLNALASDRASIEDMLQRTYTDDGNGSGKITKKGLEMIQNYGGVTPFSETANSPNASRPETFGNDLRYIANHYPAVRSSAMTLSMPVLREVVADRREVMQKYDQVMRHNETSLRKNHRDIPTDGPSDPWPAMREAKTRYLLISLAPALDSQGIISEQVEVMRDGVLLGIALTLYHRKEGRYPETLAELSPSYLPVLPVDPMNGEPLKYRVTENGPLVYSVGTNHKDDGGKPTQEFWNAQLWLSSSAEREQPEYQGDWILWPIPQK